MIQILGSSRVCVRVHLPILNLHEQVTHYPCHCTRTSFHTCSICLLCCATWASSLAIRDCNLPLSTSFSACCRRSRSSSTAGQQNAKHQWHCDGNQVTLEMCETLGNNYTEWCLFTASLLRCSSCARAPCSLSSAPREWAWSIRCCNWLTSREDTSTWRVSSESSLAWEEGGGIGSRCHYW